MPMPKPLPSSSTPSARVYSPLPYSTPPRIASRVATGLIHRVGIAAIRSLRPRKSYSFHQHARQGPSELRLQPAGRIDDIVKLDAGIHASPLQHVQNILSRGISG